MKKFIMTMVFICSLISMVACAKEEKEKKELKPTISVEDKNQEDSSQEDQSQTDNSDNTDSNLDAEDKNNALAETGTEDEKSVEKMQIKVAALKGPTAIGMVKLIEDDSTASTYHDYDFTIAGAADEITAGLLKGDFDIAAVPCNLASVLYNKTQGKIKMAAINTLGVLYVVQTGDSIKTVEDLKGKTIYSTGLGTTPQYTLNYLLSSYGIDPEKDVTIEYKSEATEVAAILSEAKDGIAMLPQPFVTTVLMNNDKASIALDVTKEWEKISEDGSTVVTGVLVVRDEFLENHADAFQVFLEEYQQSAENAVKNVDNTADLLEKWDIFKAAVAKKAVPYCNIVMITGDEMKTKVEGYLTTLYNQNSQSVGGALPGEDFYYSK